MNLAKIEQEVEDEIDRKKSERIKQILIRLNQALKDNEERVSDVEKRISHVKSNLELYADLPEGAMFPTI